MKFLKLCFFVFFLLTFSFELWGQNKATEDSLRAVMGNKSLHDTTLMLVEADLANLYYTYNLDSAFAVSERLIKKSRKTGFQRAEMKAERVKGLCYLQKGQYDKAIPAFLSVFRLAEQTEDTKEASKAYNNIGITYQRQGDYLNALDYYLKSLLIKEEIGDLAGIATSYNNIGEIYRMQGSDAKAIEYYQKSYKIQDGLGNGIGAAAALLNIGIVNQKKKNDSEAINYFKSSLELFEKNKHNTGIVNASAGLADVYSRNNNWRDALPYLQKAFPIAEKMGSKKELSILYRTYSQLYRAKGQKQLALENAEKALQIAQGINDMEETGEAATELAAAAAGLGLYEKAFTAQQLNLEISAKAQNDQARKRVSAKELEYHEEKSAIEAEKRHIIHESELKEEKILRYATMIGLVLVLALLIAVARVLYIKAKNYRIIQSQKKEITAKNEEVLQQNEEISQQRDALGRAYENMQVLGAIGQEIVHHLCVKDITKSAYLSINKLMPADCFAIGVYNEKMKRVEYKHVMENGEELPEYHDSLDGSWRLSKLCFSTKREILINDMAKDYEAYCPGTAIPDPVGGSDIARSIIFLPLVAQDRAIGNISVQSYQKNAYTQYHLGMMRNIAIYTSIALENSRAYGELAEEKEKSDKLLLNILPKRTAEELKQNGFAAPQSYDEATVIFSDFKGFTKIAEKLTPFELVHELNRCFLAFDEICEKYGIERIKTIGDAYMAVCGVPDPVSGNAYKAVCAALEMQEVVRELNGIKAENGEPVWEIRIGINTGPVVAGVIGKKKFAYDVWGDTVNVAARMEQNGEAGKVNISQFTYLKVKDSFACAHRGKVSAKNIGEVDMYFVEKNKNL